MSEPTTQAPRMRPGLPQKEETRGPGRVLTARRSLAPLRNPCQKIACELEESGDARCRAPAVLEQLAQVREEARTVGAIREAVIDAAREVHVLPHGNFVAIGCLDDARSLH